MKTGPRAQGPFGSGTPKPPNRPTRSNTFQTAAQNNAPKNPPTPKARPAWDQVPESGRGFPGMARSNTTRSPRKPGFAPNTPGGDEPQARTTSAYANVPAREYGQATRPQSQYPRPPPGPPPTIRKPEEQRPDPLKPFRSPLSSEDPFANSERMSTPYATSGGEKTYFSSSKLNRTSSSQLKTPGSGTRSGGLSPDDRRPRSPAVPGRHHSASPKMRSPGPRRSYSATSSSGSSEEDVPVTRNRQYYAFARRASADNRYSAPAHDGFPRQDKPSVESDDEERPSTEGSKPHFRSPWASQDTNGTQGIPRQYSASQPGSRKGSSGSEQAEGFLDHRTKQNAERAQQLPKSPLHANPPMTYQNVQKPLEKSKSWHEKDASGDNGNHQTRSDRHIPGDAKDSRPMYETSESNSSPIITPSSLNDSSDHVFPEEGTKIKVPASWPYWAIPSSVMPKAQDEPQKTTKPSSKWTKDNVFAMVDEANQKHFARFYLPDDTSGSNSPVKSSRNNDNNDINTNFSPSDWHGKFSGESGDHLSSKENGIRGRGRSSPTKARPYPQTPFRERTDISSPSNKDQANSSPQMPPPPTIPIRPPSPTQAKFSREEWQQHFKEPSWAYPPPPPPPAQSPRPGTMKRSKTPRPLSGTKRQAVPKPATVSATVDDAGEEEVLSNPSGSFFDSEVSSGNGSAMDIDPATTPPTASASQQPTKSDPVVHDDPIQNIIRSSIPPATNGNDTSASHLNLNDLKHTAPFTPTNSAGLKDLQDLNSTLPFESAPSAIPGQSTTPRQLALPNPPKAPFIPETLTQSSWDYYMAYMRAYMVEWSAFNHKMIAHFASRQQEVETKLGNDWMSAVGGEGYARYMRGLEEDFRVRAHWEVGWEKHRGCMRSLGRVREKAVRGHLSAS